MNLRKALAVMCAVFMLLTLCSCNSLDLSIDGLISPPRQNGNIYPIQQALEESVGKDITLKYPISGDYRSAFSFRDVDGDGFEEAVALYSKNNDGTVSMHLNVIDKIDGEWASVSDVKVVANGIEKITFCDLNRDLVPEIIVGWLIYGTVDKQVVAYSYDGVSLNQRIVESYTDFICDKLRADGNEELIIINLNSKDKVSTVKVLSINDTGIAETGSAMLDGSVTSYMPPIVATLSDGRPALYIDGVRGTGTLTEIVWFEQSTLKSTYDAVTQTSVTYRPSTVTVTDINSDGIIDVPFMNVLPSTVNKPEADKVYVTAWSNFNGKDFVTVQNTFMNYTDGYYITIPDEWMNKLHLARKTESKQRIFYSYDYENDMQGSEVFRITAALRSDIENGKFDNNGYVKLSDDKDNVYMVKVIDENVLDITAEKLSQNFHIIKQGEEI